MDAAGGGGGGGVDVDSVGGGGCGSSAAALSFYSSALPLAPGIRQVGWDLYSPTREFARIGVHSIVHPLTGEPLYRVSEANSDFSLSPTYPPVLATVARATDHHLATVAGFRSKGRLPALTWIHPTARTTMWRCSQPCVGISGKTCAQDEQLLAWVREASVFTREGPSAPLLVADCRPKQNAWANKGMGGGWEEYEGTHLECEQEIGWEASAIA